jgi:hypothetical protein
MREGRLDPARLWAHAETIAQWPREAGGEGESRAFAYIATTLERDGIATTTERGAALISLPQHATLRVNGRACAAITHAMGAPTPAAGVEGELVAASAAEERAWRGRVVAFEGIARPTSVERACCAGALAALFLDVGCVAHEMIVSSVWGSPGAEQRGRLPGIPVATVGGSDATMLRGLIAETRAPAIARLSTEVDTRWRDIPLLIADVRAPRAVDEQFVLLSGHVDSWHLGAMDNAGANAVMLELARVLHERRARLRRHVRVAFWSGHSQGRYAGSARYVDEHWSELERDCVVHLNVDSVGACGACVLSHAPSMASTHAVGARAIRQVTGQRLGRVRFTRAGDQSLTNLGVSALFMTLSEQSADGEHSLPGTGPPPAPGEQAATGGLGWWWHTPADTLDKLDLAALERDAAVYLHALEAFAAEPVVPLDVDAAAAELQAHLAELAERAASRFDLADALAESGRVASLARAAMRRAERLRADVDADEEELARFNRALLRAGRPLTRLDCAEGDWFTHDDTAPRPPVPLLALLRELIATAPGADEEHPLRIALTRRRNRVLHELRLARAVLVPVACQYPGNSPTSMSFEVSAAYL